MSIDKRKRVVFVVDMTIPDGATITDCQKYVQTAIENWRGSLRPPGGYNEEDLGDPMFSLDTSKVKVRRQWSG